MTREHLEAERLQRLAHALVALVTLGWMAGALAVAVAVSDDAGFVRDTPAWLAPALMGLLGAALAAVLATLAAIARRIRLRAAVLADALPRLLPTERRRTP